MFRLMVTTVILFLSPNMSNTPANHYSFLFLSDQCFIVCQKWMLILAYAKFSIDGFKSVDERIDLEKIYEDGYTEAESSL